MPNLGRAVKELRSERDALQHNIDRLDKAITTLAGLNGSGRRGKGRRGGTRNLAAGARKRIADAQRARWAKWKARHRKASHRKAA